MQKEKIRKVKLVDISILENRLKQDLKSSKIFMKKYSSVCDYNEAQAELINQENFEYFLTLIKELKKNGKLTE